MRTLLFPIALFLALAAVLTPTALWIYQSFQFGGWQWDLGRMSADRIVATGAKAVVFSAVLAAMAVVRPQWLGLRARQRRH